MLLVLIIFVGFPIIGAIIHSSIINFGNKISREDAEYRAALKARTE